MALTQENILTFLVERGGQVRNAELLNYFRSRINCRDVAEKQRNRDLFKRLVNSVAVVKQVDGVKFVVAKKRYRDFVKGDAGLEDGRLGIPNPSPWSNRDRGASSKMLKSDAENNNVCYSSQSNGNAAVGDLANAQADISTDTTVKVLNMCRTGGSGAVFGVIAVKSPPRAAPGSVSGEATGGVNSEGGGYKTPEKNDFAPKALSRTAPAIKRYCQMWDRWSSSQSCEDILHAMATRDQNKTTRQGDDPKDSESVPLETIAHEWLVKCAAGLWGQIYGLLLQDAQLANTKDFMSGFTALHWAAKGGNSDMVHKIMDISESRGTYVNVNSQTHGGYTPLHIAAIHGHSGVMVLLVQGYGAMVNVRDNAGKKPYHYLDNGVSAEVKELLGGLQQDQGRDKTEDQESRDLPKGLNTISKLFQPHIGHRRRHRH